MRRVLKRVFGVVLLLGLFVQSALLPFAQMDRQTAYADTGSTYDIIARKDGYINEKTHMQARLNTFTGKDEPLTALLSSSSQVNLVIYMQFDLRTIDAEHMDFAQLELYAATGNRIMRGINVYDLGDAQWSENTLTWMCAPRTSFDGETPVATIEMPAQTENKVYDTCSVDISELIRKKKAEGKQLLNIALLPTKEQYVIYVHSKENDSVNVNPPKLVIGKGNGWTEQEYGEIIEEPDLPIRKPLGPEAIEFSFNGFNCLRERAWVVIYDFRNGKTSGTNEFGTDLVCNADGRVISVGGYDNVIPEKGFVISAHGAATPKIFQYLPVGTLISFDYDTFKYYVSVPEGLSYRVDGQNRTVTYGEMIIFTEDFGETTKSSTSIFEVVCDASGKITKVGGNNNTIPQGGFVIGGSGKGSEFLQVIARVGAPMTYDALNNTITISFGADHTKVSDNKVVDLNNDGTVDVNDMLFVTERFDEDNRNADWDAISKADVNGDGMVSMSDIMKEAEMIADPMLQPKVTIPPAKKPVIKSFKADKSVIRAGESITLTWELENAEKAELVTPRTYDVFGTNSKTFTPSATTEYKLTIRNADEVAATASVFVEMLPLGDETQVFQWPDYIMEDQMEYNDFHMWDFPETTVGTIDLVTEQRYSGDHSVRFVAPATAAKKNVTLYRTFRDMRQNIATGYDVMYGRCYFMLGNDFQVASGEKVEIFCPTTARNVDPISIENVDGKLLLSSQASQQSHSKKAVGTTELVRGKWYCLGFYVHCGETDGTFAAYLDGKEEYRLEGLYETAQMRGVRAGFNYEGTSQETKGTIYIDDVFIDTKPIENPRLRLYAPDFRGRIGVKTVVMMSDFAKTDRLVATLTSNKGYSKQVDSRTNLTSGKQEIKVDIRNLPAATYTYTVKLISANGAVKGTVSTTFRKDYEGDPAEYSIDENNNITYKGKPFFVITGFGQSHKVYAEWYENGYHNLGMATTWGLGTGAQTYKDYLDAIVDNYPDAKNIGPTFDYGMDAARSAGVEPGRWDPVIMMEYINLVKDHKAHAWWMWREEPDNWRYPSPEVKTWWDLAKLNTPSILTENLLMGYSYISRASGAGWRHTMRNHHWPYLNADIYSWDIYPTEREPDGIGYDVFADAMDSSITWNMDLVPVFPNIQTCDCTLNAGGGTPTVTEVLHMAWSMVIHGAKGIHWYPYSGVTPPENWAAMTKFMNDTTYLTDIILGEDITKCVGMTMLQNGRIDYAVRTDGTDVYLLAVNINRASERATFDVLALNPSSIEVYGENRTLAVSGGKFSDDFSDLQYHIYKLVGVSKQSLQNAKNYAMTYSLSLNSVEKVTGGELMLMATNEQSVYPLAINATNFPDPVFRGCIQKFDKNGDLKISSTEILMIKNIVISDNSYLKSVQGIELLPELEMLALHKVDVSAVDVSKNSKLKTLILNETPISSIDVSKNAALQLLIVSDTNISRLNVTGNPLLETLFCDNTSITTLNVSNNANLSILKCNNTGLASLDVSRLSKLTRLWCNDTKLTALNLATNANLVDLYCNDTGITSLDVSRNSKLTDLICSRTGITTLNLANNTALYTLNCNQTKLTALDVSRNSNLRFLRCSGNALAYLNLAEKDYYDFVAYDASGQPTVRPLSITGNVHSVPTTEVNIASALPGFNANNATNLNNCTISNGILRITNANAMASYTYQMNSTHRATFYLSAQGGGSQEQPLPGDMNGDRVIDLQDLSFVTNNMGKTNSAPDWAEVNKADINKDGAINLLDLVSLARMM